ncbi:DUF4012 domain-containing protein [Candidatus Woesebacteria bacterium]|nr:DUF4012 domain-containing protein [Candidatus Woesebacteria bacterium]
MFTQHYTTELEESQVTICVIDAVGYFFPFLEEYFREKNVAVTNISIQEFTTTQAQEKLQEAYKILVCLSPTQDISVIRPVLQQLSGLQHKLKIVLPVHSGCQLGVIGEIPYLAQYQESQKIYITECNDLLPQTPFIFGQDVIFSPGKNGFFDLCCQQIQSGLVFAPTTAITPITQPNFCRCVVDVTLQPDRTSTAIMGRMKSAAKCINRIAQLYEQYYFSDIATQSVGAYELKTIPFSVKQTLVAEDEESILAWYTKQLPSPDQRPFFYPAFSVPEQDFLPLQETPVFSEQPEQFIAESVQESFQETIEPPPKIIESIILQQPQTLSTPKQEFNVATEIQRIFVSSHQEKTLERAETLIRTKSRLKKKSKKRKTLFYGGLIFTSVGLLALVVMSIYLASFYFFKQALAASLESNSDTTIKNEQRLITYSKILGTQVSLYQKIASLPQLDEAHTAVLLSQKIQKNKRNEEQTQQDLKKMFLSIIGKDTANITNLAENIGKQSLETYENLSTMEEDIRQISFSQTTFIDPTIERLKKQISQLKKEVSVQQQLQQIVSGVFGLHSKRTYAFVLQNNQELRPTGGFIESVALVTLDNGVIVNREVYTSYELDKKLPGEVIAPAEVTQAIGEKTFFFHDSNWNPDFPQSAEQMTWFIEKSLQRQIDGVFTIDLETIKNTLEVLGPLDLPEFNEVITNKNIFERMEFHSEVILVESDKNQDYRKLLLTRFLEKIQTIPEEKIPAFLSSIKDSFAKQSMLAYFKDAQEQQVSVGLGWSGSQRVPRCPQELSTVPCQVDSVMQVEANVGINKANYYLERSVDHVVTLSPTLANHRRTITYKNLAQINAWPKGTYKNYIRLYIPLSANSIQIKLDGIALPPTQLHLSEENGQRVVGFLMEVPIKTTKTLTFEYAVPLVTEGTSAFSYVLYNQTQPGSGVTPAVIHFQADSSLHPTLITPEAAVAADGIVFTVPDLETTIYGVQFDQAK